MSYEGYNQLICELGHLYQEPEQFGRASPCHCGAPAAWCNAVDDTNCDAYGIIKDFSSLLIEPEETKVCDCGYTHVIKHARYRIPTEAETRALQQRWDYVQKKYFPLHTTRRRVRAATRRKKRKR